jgi:6-pyruvoyltetrahydropterin/6-carboxytetrahydropterin synthase
MRESMTRKIGFSSGHRYWFAKKTDQENKSLFGNWGSKYNHGHNYVLDTTVAGDVNELNGMIVNIKDIDVILKNRLLPQFANRSINDEIPRFESVAPCLENLLLYIWHEILAAGLPSEVELTNIKLEEMPSLYGEYDGMKTTITRTYEFAASHRLHVPSYSPEKNLELFGKCNNEAGHGHNYLLEVTVSGEPHPTTGMLCSIDDLDAAVHREVVDRYDHKNFNYDIPEFENCPTTSEFVARVIYQRLQNSVPATLERIRLHETARNIFEVCKIS